MDKEYLRDKYGKKLADYKGDWNDEYVAWLEFNIKKANKNQNKLKKNGY